MNGLIIKEPWIDYILSGNKVWEIRGSRTNIRGEILLIKSGTGCIYGKAELYDCVELSLMQYQNSKDKHMILESECETLPYQKTYAWKLRNVTKLDCPIPYSHPRGAIIWVKCKYEGDETC